jgi:hypothetical protein
VEQQIGEMMVADIHPEHFAIEHVRNVSERLPIRAFGRGKCPFQPGPVQPSLDAKILADIVIVVIICEAEL